MLILSNLTSGADMPVAHHLEPAERAEAYK